MEAVFEKNDVFHRRSKAVRAYIVDLFGNYDEVKGLHELEEKIGESINLYYK